jgi:hypothetical protein
MIELLEKEFPKSEVYLYLDTGPFIVVYTTSHPFANWCGRLLERLHLRYVERWKRLGVELTKPEFPLVALVFSNEERFRQYAKQEGSTLTQQQCAYYHRLTNRIAMYDMSGMQAIPTRDRRPAQAAMFWVLPGAYYNVMTVIHEATHLVGFNTGMHSRYTREPLWLHEGLAVFHEVPDQNNKDIGWTPGPHVNRYRLDQLRKFLMQPQPNPPIQQMISDDELIRQQNTALDNYALAWGLIYYLDRKKPKELVAYLKLHQEKTLDSDDLGNSDKARIKEIRIKDFESCFGEDWEKFYKEFFDYLRRL